MPNKLTVYNGSLRLLGERALASLTENREARRKADEAWDDMFMQYVLEAGQWGFAKRTQLLTYSPSISPSFGYQYAFEKPEDWVRTTAVCQDEYYRNPLLEYQWEAGFWFADLDEIYVRYVSKDPSYGADLSLWPARFTLFAEAHLACRIRPGLQQSQVQLGELEKQRDQWLKDALNTDAFEEPTRFPSPGSWAVARSGGGWRGGGYRR